MKAILGGILLSVAMMGCGDSSPSRESGTRIDVAKAADTVMTAADSAQADSVKAYNDSVRSADLDRRIEIVAKFRGHMMEPVRPDRKLWNYTVDWILVDCIDGVQLAKGADGNTYALNDEALDLGFPSVRSILTYDGKPDAARSLANAICERKRRSRR